MVDFNKERSKLDSISDLTIGNVIALKKLFTDQRRLLKSSNSLWFLPPNFFVREDGKSFHQRNDPENTDIVRVRRQQAEVSEPALVKESASCIKSFCQTISFGEIYQNWVPLRRPGTLKTDRKLALYKNYADDYKIYIKDVYELDASTLPSFFFDSIFHVDHLVPSGWLMRPRAKRGLARDPRFRLDDSVELEEASQFEELVEYVSLALVPSAVNMSWGAYEGNLKRCLERQNSKGGATLVALAKAAGIPCCRSGEDEIHWMVRLYKTLAKFGFLPAEEARTLLDLFNSDNATSFQWDSLDILDSSPLSTAWLELESTVPAGVSLKSTDLDQHQTRKVICEFIDGTYIVSFDDANEILARNTLARGDVLQSVQAEAHRMANILLTHYGMSPVKHLDYTYIGLP